MDFNDKTDALRRLQTFIQGFLRRHPEVVSLDDNRLNITYRYNSNTDRPEIYLNGAKMDAHEIQEIQKIIAVLEQNKPLPTPIDSAPNSNPIDATMAVSKDYLIDIFDDNEHLTIIAELPSVSKHEIQLTALSTTELEIIAGDYQQKIQLPAPIDDKRVKARLNNGILEISLLKQPDTTHSRRIAVE